MFFCGRVEFSPQLLEPKFGSTFWAPELFFQGKYVAREIAAFAYELPTCSTFCFLRPKQATSGTLCDQQRAVRASCAFFFFSDPLKTDPSSGKRRHKSRYASILHEKFWIEQASTSASDFVEQRRSRSADSICRFRSFYDRVSLVIRVSNMMFAFLVAVVFGHGNMVRPPRD